MEAGTTPRQRPGTPGSDSVEVPFEQALAENDGTSQIPSTAAQDHDQADPPVSSEPEPIDDLEILAPKIKAKQWTFGPEGSQLTYVQRELSTISKTQWFSLVGEFLDRALGGENSISLNSLLSPPENVRGSAQNLRIEDFQDADTFVHAIGKLVMFAPEFLEKSICIWLEVPDHEWDYARMVMKQSPEVGGLSDDMTEEIMATFLDQNYKALSSFFRDRFGNLRKRWQARQKEAEQSRSQKR